MLTKIASNDDAETDIEVGLVDIKPGYSVASAIKFAAQDLYWWAGVLQSVF